MPKLPTGLELPKQDNLAVSIRLARERLAALDAVAQARRAGCRVEDSGGEPEAILELVGKPVRVVHLLGGGGAPSVVDGSSGEPLAEMQQALVLHYLVHGTGPVPPEGELVDFVQIPEGAFYGDPFRRRAEVPLERAFGERAVDLVEAGRLVGAEPVSGLGDAAVAVRALPLVAITLVLWQGDEELGPKAKVLFRENVVSLLSADDVAALSGMVIYPLVAAWGGRRER